MNHGNHTVPCDCSTCNKNKSDNYKHEPPEKPLICGEHTAGPGVGEGRNVEHTHLVPQFTSVAQPLPIVGIAASCHNSAAFQPVFNFHPTFFNYYGYYGKVGTGPGYPPSSFGSSGVMFPAELPQLQSGPGLLTAAGYQPGHTLTPTLRLLLPGHAGTPLHSAAIIGEKQKLADILQDKNVNLEARDGWGRAPFVYTVLGNHQECTEMLLKAGAKPDATDCHNRTPLHYASYKGHLGCIKAILHAVETRGISQAPVSSGVWLAQDRRGVTPLHHAAVHDNHKCLQTLLKYAAPGTLDTEDHKKRTPLHWAAAYGSEENVRLLIKHGANILLPDQEGKIPLHWASMSKAEGAKNCVRTLIGAAPSSVNWQDFDGITALHLAVAEARKDSVDVILSVKKCSINLTDNHYRTALHWACNRGLTSIVDRLVEQGSSLMVVDMYGATPLHYAAQLNHTNTVELVMRQPCVRDNPSKEGHTALHWAAARGADSALAAMVRHGAPLTRTDLRGCTALHIAAGAGHVATVGVLLRLRAPVDVCALDGRTPLLHAAQAGHTHIVKVLVKAGASLGHRDSEGQCALHHAVLGGHLYLAQILLRAGTSVNIQDYSGRTPLHMAAFRGLSDIMFLLLENRGDVNARDNQGQSPLHWAAQQGHLGAVNTLLDFHAYLNYTRSTPDRYTALDCAYVAEHLEVAEVLMEAGGLSVTKITEVAATKIQALARGYLIRRNGQRMKPWMHQRDDYCLEVPSETTESLGVKETGGEHVQQRRSASQESLHTQSCTDKQLNESEEVEELVDVLRASPSPVLLRRAGQRRSKGLASSIRKGPRKKTERNLDLPDPGELGIEQPVDNHTTGINQAVIEDDTVPESVAKETTLAVAGMLKRSGTIAAAVISIRDEKERIGRDNLNETNCEPNVSTEEEFETHEDIPLKLTAIDSKFNTCRSIGMKSDMIESNREESQALNNIGVKQDIKPNKQISISLNDGREENHCGTGNQEISKKSFCNFDIDFQKRKQILEEKTAASLRIIGELDTGQSKYESGQHSLMTAEMKQRAVDRWNKKLASLQLHTTPHPCSTPTRAPFSYNLISTTTTTPRLPPHKNRASRDH